MVRSRKVPPGEHQHGPEYDEGVPYPGLGHTAYLPGFDSRLFLQRNRPRMFLTFVGNGGFRALTRAAPIQIARLLKQRTPLAQAFTQHRADRQPNQN